MSVKISELPLLSDLADNDVLASVDTSANATKKIELATLKEYIDTNTQYTAGTNIDITNNVVSAPNVYNKTEVDEIIEEKDEQIEELQEELDAVSTIYNAFPTVSDEDTSMTLDGTAESKFKKLDLKGNTSQETTTGKNILPLTSTQTTIGGIPISVEDGIIKLNGTTNSNSNWYTSIFQFNSGGAVFSLEVTGYTDVSSTNASVIIQQSDAGTSPWSTSAEISLKSDREKYKTLTLDSTKYYRFRLFVDSNTFTNATIKVQLEYGSTPTSWEKFTYGASPNPSYPQDIHVVSGDNTIVSTGKNLFDVKGYLEDRGVSYTENSDGSLTFSTSQILYAQPFEFGNIGKVSLQAQITNDTTSNFRISLLNDSGTSQGSVTSESANLQNKSATKLRFDWSSVGQVTIKNVMLNKGETIETYEPFGEKYKVNLPVENLLNKEIIVSGNISNYEVTQLPTGVRLLHKNSYSTGVPILTLTLKPNTTYTFSQKANATSGDPGSGIKTTNGSYSYVTTGSKTITTESDGVIIILFGSSLGSGVSCDYTDIQLEEGTKQNSFTPYGTTPIELCKIGDYQDYFYKDSGKWYKYGAIQKYVFNGSENWTVQNAGTSNFFYRYRYLDNFYYVGSNDNWISDKIIGGSISSTSTVEGMFISQSGETRIRYGSEMTSDNFKIWLSTNNITLYYQANTPTNTEITYQPLIEQLNNIEKAMSKDGQTNISQVNNDLPFIISAEAIMSLQNVLDRIELLES